MKTFYGRGKSHPSGPVRFFKGKAYNPDKDGDYVDEAGGYWTLIGMKVLVESGFIFDTPRPEENE